MSDDLRQPEWKTALKITGGIFIGCIFVLFMAPLVGYLFMMWDNYLGKVLK